MRRTLRRGIVAVAALCLMVAVTGAGAPSAVLAAGPKPAKTGKGGESATGLPAASLAKLKSNDLLEVRAGLDDARMAGKDGAAAVPQIAALLASGLPYPLAEAAIDTLGDIQSADGPAAIAPYARHRETRIRRAAIRALAKAIGPSAVAVAAPTLRTALSDPDPQVRALAATGLGSLRAKAGVLDLFVALDHKVYEAAVSIGQLCEPADCDALVGRLGKIPFDVVTTGLDPILFRPANEVSEAQKIALVDRVRDIGTHDANTFLKDVLARWPKTGSAKVRREIDAAVLATVTSPGGAR